MWEYPTRQAVAAQEHGIPRHKNPSASPLNVTKCVLQLSLKTGECISKKWGRYPNKLSKKSIHTIGV
jgi:hypothetical protein